MNNQTSSASVGAKTGGAKNSMSKLAFLPLFMDLKHRQVLVVGQGEKAARKVELLLQADASIVLCFNNATEEIKPFLTGDSGIKTVSGGYVSALLKGMKLVVAATETDQDVVIASEADAAGIPVNVVNQASLSTFIFPSIINRSPVIAAVSSSGKLPVFTRLIRNQLEAAIPASYGRLVEVAERLRNAVNNKFPDLNARRRFWEANLNGRFAELVYSGNETAAEKELEQQLGKAQFSLQGEVYLVGAGPGDPDLLTLKALRLIRQADVVVYDRLVSDEILAKVRQDAEKIHVGKERSNHTLPQEGINALLVSLAKQGKRVLRLKGGDPFIFGRGGEEIGELAEAGVPFQVVPGITAASGCACYAGIPLTHRDYSQSVRFITGHLKNNTCDLPWKEYIADGQTLVFYMGLTGLSTISEQLIAHGKAENTPVALVSKGTTREQRVLTSTLGHVQKALMLEESKGSPFKAPTLIIIGEVVSLRDELRWFD